MPANCVTCGQPLNRPNARFCPHCGAPQPAPGAPPGAGPPAPPPPLPPPTQRIPAAAPAQLTVQEPGAPPRSVALPPLPVVVGSAAGPGILTVAHPAVAPRHLLLDEQAGTLYVTDLGGGAALNGRFLTPHLAVALADGDIVRIADGRGNSIGLLLHGGAPPPPLVSVDLGTLQVGKAGRVTLGRDASCGVRLDHPTVSRLHAEVEHTAQGDLLLDRSANGTFVNGQRVRGRRLLHAGDVVHIGPFRLVYAPGALTQAAPAKEWRLDALHLSRRVGAGGLRLPGAAQAGALLTPPAQPAPPAPVGKLILDDVCLSVYPREFVALVGGSGAGKSTLMKALSGFTPAEGQVLLNGDDLYRNFGAYRTVLGYVPQDDIIHGQLTVHSALLHAARLRLPDAAPGEIEQRITAVLDQVEMRAHAGKAVNRLSGGQRKRVSIAVELLADPGLFFLDEPTSGLDPGLEKKMMLTLRQLADNGRTVVLVTHATANIDQCDHVAFMADGRLAYYGPPRDALRFFGARDFADIYTRLTHPLDPVKNPPPPGAPPAPGLAASAAWAACYAASADCRRWVTDRLRAVPPAAPPAPPAAAQRQKDSALRQFAVLVRRNFELIRRDAGSLITLLAVMPLIGLLLLVMANRADLTGLAPQAIYADVQQQIDDAWLAEDDPSDADQQFQGGYAVAGSAQKVIFMLALAAGLLGVFAAAYEIVREQPIYQRERMVNLKLAPYLGSKLAVLALFSAVQCALLLWVVGWKVDYPAHGVLLPAWLELYATLFLASLTGLTLGLLISAAVRSQNTVIYLILLALFVQIMFAGAIFELPGAAAPISYLAPTRWALEALGSTVDMERLNGLAATCIEPEDGFRRGMLGDPGLPCEAGQQLLAPELEFNVAYRAQAGHLLGRWGALLLLAACFGALTLAAQKRKDVV